MIAPEQMPADLDKQRAANARLATKWLAQIERYRGNEKKWREQAREVNKRYRDDRNGDDNSSKFNILWANTEVQKPAILARMPVPDVRRRYLTADPVARTAAMIIERSLSYSISVYDFEDVLARVNEDYLLPGRAQAYVCYEPLILSRPAPKQSPTPPGQDDEASAEEDMASSIGALPQGMEKAPTDPSVEEYKAWETVTCKYTRWDMFGFSDCAQWSECPAAWIGEYMTKEQVKRYFPDFTDIDRLPWGIDDNTKTHDNDDYKRPSHTVTIWKVWHKEARKYMVFCEGYAEAPLRMVDDPQQLENFYPFGEPLYSLRTNGSWIPKPEFLQYQDQANELDIIVNRLRNLINALKVRGVYDQAMDAVSKFSDLVRDPDLSMKPVPNFRELAEKGGLERLMSFLPLEQVATAIVQLREREAELKAEIYEICGIADIMRGASQASETLGAQQLKAQYGGLRVSTRQGRMQRFIRDIFRIKAEIICEHFSPDTLRLMCGIQVVPDLQYQQAKQDQSLPVGAVSESEFMAACHMIRNDKLRGFNIDIESDSTIPVDRAGEQQNRVAFIAAIGQYLQGIIPAVQSGAIPMKVAREALLFVVRGFKVGSELEEVLEELGANDDQAQQLAQLKQMQAQMQQQLQSLSQENAQLKETNSADMARAQADIQVSNVKAQNDMAVDTAKAQNKMTIDANANSNHFG